MSASLSLISSPLISTTVHLGVSALPPRSCAFRDTIVGTTLGGRLLSGIDATSTGWPPFSLIHWVTIGWDCGGLRGNACRQSTVASGLFAPAPQEARPMWGSQRRQWRVSFKIQVATAVSLLPSTPQNRRRSARTRSMFSIGCIPKQRRMHLWNKRLNQSVILLFQHSWVA